MSSPPGIWRERLITDATATTAVQNSKYVEPGDRWFLRRIAVSNNTSLGADVEIQIETQSYSHVLHRFRSLEIAESEAQDLGIWLSEGERVRLSWTGIADGDRLEAHLTGVKRLTRPTSSHRLPLDD